MSNTRTLAERMGERAAKFLASLDEERRATAQYAFPEPAERTRWFYTPNPRNGLPLRDMTRRQVRLALQLITLGVSRTGYALMTTIMGLEPLLDAVEAWAMPEWSRDPTRYHLTVFGDPGTRSGWGWRFEGHHVSLNFTIVDGRLIAPTPSFFGANPADTPLGAQAFLRPLAAVEDLARELARGLSPEQRASAMLAPAAPPDLMTANRPQLYDGAVTIPASIIQGQVSSAEAMERATREQYHSGYTPLHETALAYTFNPKGLAASALSSGQRDILMQLIREYIGRMPDEVAELELAQLQAEGIDGVYFVWAGSLERHQGHYYRVQGSRFLLEYDNTQNDANHIHSVWRDAANDFGTDLLAQHYALAHI